MEKMNEDELKRELPFDLYGRYAIIRDIVDRNRKGEQKFKILDVGGRGNLLKRFLANDDVFYIDPFVDSEDENFIKGDGCSMPLDDGSFDWVTSADVFEHIPEQKRKDFLEENARVARLGMILVAPFYSEEVKQAEDNANENYKNFSGGNDHMWLKEHMANGLPKEDEIKQFIKKRNLAHQKLGNNQLFLWENIIAVNFFVWNNFSDEVKKFLYDFNYFYNNEVFPYDNGEPSYRKIYFIKKDPSLIDLKVAKKSMDDKLFLNVIKKTMDLIGVVDIENKKVANGWQREIELVKIEIEKKNEELRNLNVQFGQLRMERKKKDIELREKDKEIQLMASSKFWKMRDKYIKLKSMFINQPDINT